MSRNRLMPALLTPLLRVRFVIALLCLATLPLGLVIVPAAQAAQPNVVILLADDLGWADVGYHGSPIETPSIDRLATEGVQLDRFYAAPICSPTRAALMTGQDPLKLGIAYDQIHPWYNAGLSPNALTLADIFKADGYQTGLIGKWHLGHTVEHQLPNAQGFDEFWGHLHTNTDFYKHVRDSAHDLQHNGKSVHEDGQYLTHLEGREAVRFIRERDKTQPFLLYVPFTAPHSPMQAPQETIEKYAALPQTNFRRTYAAMVDEMDQAIGQILAALDDEGIAGDTIVLFMSDNGGSTVFGGVNTPLRGQKGTTFEGGVRVPAIIRWPQELEAGTKMTQMMTVMDVMPTLARASKVRMPTTANLDGVSMWSALSKSHPVLRTRPVGFVSEIPLPGVVHTAIYDGRWKLVQVLREQQDDIEVRDFLFDVEADPNEENDLSQRHGAVLKRLKRLMFEWRKQHPLGGTRGTLVAHPGWVAPRDWADAVLPAKKMQSDWKNEFSLSREIFEATDHLGVLVDAKTERELIQANDRRKRAQEAASKNE